MLETSARLLRLLSLLQARPDWTGADLADRLAVTTRTVRRDVDRLRDLGYPVESTPGVAGGYRLGVGAALPPLLLDDDEAVAVAVGLRAAAAGSVAGIEESSLRALAKLDQVLPARLRHRLAAMRAAITPLVGTGAAAVDAELLARLASAVRMREGVRFPFRGQPRRVEPYRLVSTGRRWYLLAFDLDRDDWRTFRLDRVEGPVQPGARFAARPLPADDLDAYLSDRLTSAPYRYQATVVFHAPLAAVAERTSPTAGRLEPRDEGSCWFHAGAATLDDLALHLALKGFEFDVVKPPELAERVRDLAGVLARAAAGGRITP